MNYGYIRVSTDAQTTRNQRYEILRFCKADEVQRLLAAGIPKTDIARRLGVSRGTLYRWLKGRG